jgi:hypothetical protein
MDGALADAGAAAVRTRNIIASRARRIGGSKHAAVAVAALLAVLPAPALAAAPPQWAAEASEIAAPWPGLQEADGRFRDYVIARDPTGVRDDYGDAMLGYGLLLTSARTGDAALADSGLRALELSLDHPARSPSTQVFHQLALVSAYNLARERFASHPVFTRARGRWEEVLRRIAVYRLGRRAVTNKSIVESVMLIELLRSGLSSSEPGAALADPAATRALVKRFLATGLPKASKPFERGGRALLGDMPLLPPAYHGLSVGVLARAVELLGDEAPAAARSLLRRAADASVAATAPDGDVAYHGRSQAQAWTLSLTGYGAEVAAVQPGASGRAASYRGLARRAIGRLATSYGTGPEGFLITPSLVGNSVELALPGLDEYVAAVSYAGLTLASLEWAIASATDGSTRGNASGVTVLGNGTGSWATSRAGGVWFAVKRARTSTRDLRYDAGLVALKVRGDGGSWTDVMPPRPRTLTNGDFGGPILLTTFNSGGGPELTELRRGRGGRVVGRGGFRTRSGRWLRRGVTFTFTPVSCGVRLTWAARRGDHYGYAGFFRKQPELGDDRISDDSQTIRVAGLGSLSSRAGYSSGADASLIRGIARFEHERAGTAAITICGR